MLLQVKKKKKKKNESSERYKIKNCKKKSLGETKNKTGGDRKSSEEQQIEQ